MSDFYTEYLKSNNKRTKLEQKLDEYNHTMELIRTILPVVIIVLQVIILVKIIWNLNHLKSLKIHY